MTTLPAYREFMHAERMRRLKQVAWCFAVTVALATAMAVVAIQIIELAP